MRFLFLIILWFIKYNSSQVFPSLGQYGRRDVVASPVILLPVFPVCLTAIRDANLRSPEQIGVFRRSEFSVKEIFTGDHNWDRYYYVHRQEIRPVARAEVEKMLSCKGVPGGAVSFTIAQSAIANSRICGYDGKEVAFWYVDRERLSSTNLRNLARNWTIGTTSVLAEAP